MHKFCYSRFCYYTNLIDHYVFYFVIRRNLIDHYTFYFVIRRNLINHHDLPLCV